MNIPEITHPLGHSTHQIWETLCVGLRRVVSSCDRVRVSLRNTRAAALPEKSTIVVSVPRWTRETENPFDIPMQAFRDAIR